MRCASCMLIYACRNHRLELSAELDQYKNLMEQWEVVQEDMQGSLDLRDRQMQQCVQSMMQSSQVWQ